MIKVRGLKKADENDLADTIFNNITENIANVLHQEYTDLLGLNEWRKREELRKDLLPHDEITRRKDFYTLTPLGVRYLNPEHRKDILRLYDRLKAKQDEEGIAALTALESLDNWESYKQSKKRASKKLQN